MLPLILLHSTVGEPIRIIVWGILPHLHRLLLLQLLLLRLLLGL